MGLKVVGEGWRTIVVQHELVQDFSADAVPDSIADMPYRFVWKPLEVFFVSKYCSQRIMSCREIVQQKAAMLLERHHSSAAIQTKYF